MTVTRKHPTRIVARMTMDQKGHRWRIAEMDAPNAKGISLSRCLVVSSNDRCLRLWSYPAEWQIAPVETLLALADSGARSALAPRSPVQAPSGADAPGDVSVSAAR